MERENHVDTTMRRLSAINDPAATMSFSGISTDTNIFTTTNNNYLFHDCYSVQDGPSILPCLAPSPAPERWEAAVLANQYGAPDFMQAIMSLTTREEDAALLAYSVEHPNLFHTDSSTVNTNGWDAALTITATLEAWLQKGVAPLWDSIPAL